MQRFNYCFICFYFTNGIKKHFKEKLGIFKTNLLTEQRKVMLFQKNTSSFHRRAIFYYEMIYILKYKKKFVI